MQYTNAPAQLEEVQEEIRAAAQKAGRKPEEIGLIAVSKLHPWQAVQSLAQAGHKDFGENYIQEALQKQEELKNKDLRWHFIGHLQSNKAKFVPGNFHLVHTVDSLKLARALHKKAKEHNIRQSILIQVDLAGEEQKSGLPKSELLTLVEEVLELPHLDLQGLMCMPPFFQDGEKTRPYFIELRQCRDRIAERFALQLPHLSMGMTADFVQAIEEGATLVRIGTRIFGSRPE
jgi:pyridoxal phosphate enzyme (YggS family)